MDKQRLEAILSDRTITLPNGKRIRFVRSTTQRADVIRVVGVFEAPYRQVKLGEKWWPRLAQTVFVTANRRAYLQTIVDGRRGDGQATIGSD